MKLNGIDETDHKIFPEIERNRAFIKKIKEVEENLDHEVAGSMPEKRLKLDTAAAMRMVKPHLRQSIIQAEQEEKTPQPQVIFFKEMKQGEVRMVNKGSILPKRNHLNWKEQLEKMQK